MLYGPPAVGKLTVAKELAGLTGLRLVDNHTTSDPSSALFDFGTAEFFDLTERIRVVFFEAAADAGISVVSTLVYADPEDQALVSKMSAAAVSAGATFATVQLSAPMEVLEQRVASASRIGTRKIVDPELLHRTFATWDLTKKVHEDDMSFDTSAFSAFEIASKIAVALDLAST